MTLADDAVALIDRDELVETALALCNIDSAGPTEGPVAEYISDWLRREGFKVRQLGLQAERFNVVGTLPGTGGGYSLLFNSHMDTAIRWGEPGRKDANDDLYHKAWVEGGDLVGEGIVNDKGPLAAFLIAGKAVKATGVTLKGDLLLTGVIAETASEPSDDLPGSLSETKDLGARYLLTHGGVADFVVVAEGTGFGIVAVEAGMVWFKITWVSDEPGFYLPYLPDRTTMNESPSMIVRAALGIQTLERWATQYQDRYAYDSASGRVVPKAQVGAIHGGDSNRLTTTCQVCNVYVGVFTPPGLDPLVLKEEVAEALRSDGVPASEIDLYLFRPGYEAKNADVIIDALREAHRDTLGGEPPPPFTPTLSMWRDINVWNEVGIPAVTYGPRHENFAYRRALSIESLYQAACVYARTVVKICNQEKPRAAGNRSVRD